jgi:hypothetical protein
MSQRRAPHVLKPVPVTPIREAQPGPSQASKDCADELRRLLNKAERGEVVGIAIAVMSSGKSFSVDAIGNADTNPTFTLGMVEILKSELINKVHKR